MFADRAGVMSRDDIAKSAEKGRWHDVSLTQKGVAEPSDESAIISYECTARKKDGQPYHALISSGYIRRADGWKLAFHQQTPVQ